MSLYRQVIGVSDTRGAGRRAGKTGRLSGWPVGCRGQRDWRATDSVHRLTRAHTRLRLVQSGSGLHHHYRITGHRIREPCVYRVAGGLIPSGTKKLRGIECRKQPVGIIDHDSHGQRPWAGDFGAHHRLVTQIRGGVVWSTGIQPVIQHRTQVRSISSCRRPEGCSTEGSSLFYSHAPVLRGLIAAVPDGMMHACIGGVGDNHVQNLMTEPNGIRLVVLIRRITSMNQHSQIRPISIGDRRCRSCGRADELLTGIEYRTLSSSLWCSCCNHHRLFLY
jgi:hypothetical protein